MKLRTRSYNNYENKDRLSELSDAVLLQILSILNNVKEAVQTCILSKRWTNIWKRLTILSLDSRHFKTLGNFTKFVSRFLSLRDTKTALHSLNFHREGITESPLLKRIFIYAASHDVRHLDISVIFCIDDFSLSNLLSHTRALTSLNLSANNKYSQRLTPIFSNSLNLPALTSLCLKYFAFRGNGNDICAEPFSSFISLNTLIIYRCKILDGQNLLISSATLVDLTIKSNDKCKIELSTPNLHNFDFKGTPVQKLSGSNRNLFSIKQVNIDALIYSRVNSLVLLDWVTELANIESLTITIDVLKILCRLPDFPYLHNLKTLKVKTDHPSILLPDGVVNFLHEKAPLTEVEIIDLSRTTLLKDTI